MLLISNYIITIKTIGREKARERERDMTETERLTQK